MSGPGEFADKVVFVTGSSRGIGAEIAEEFASFGAKLIINCNENLDEARTTLETIVSLSPDSTLMIGDVRVEDDMARIRDHIETRYGKLDVLINNAGIVNDSLIEKMSLKQWEEVIATNLTGIFLATKECLPLLRKSETPRIVSISSVVAQMGNIGQVNYSASKGGVISMTKTLAREFARDGILVNAVAPGFISTRMTEGIPEKVLDKIRGNIPLRRLGDPSDVARTVLFLASPENKYVTGQIIGVNGGLY